MRNVVLWAAAAVMLLLVVGAMSSLPPTAAEQPRAAAGIDAGAMSRAMDMSLLPKQELSPDIYR